VLTPVPIVLPSKSQSKLSTRLLNDLVKAVVNAVIFGPTFFQLSTSYTFLSPLFRPFAISSPNPSQSSERNASRILSAHLLTYVSPFESPRSERTSSTLPSPASPIPDESDPSESFPVSA